MRAPNFLLFAVLLCSSLPASAQQALNGSNQVSYSFESFDGSGFAPEPTAGQLDSDEWIARHVNTRSLDFGDTGVTGDFANGTSTGGESAGGIWAFVPVATRCASGPRTLLGAQPSSRTFTHGSFRLRVRNATGEPLTQVALGYTLAYLNDADRSVVHSIEVLRLDGTGAETASLEVPGFDFETPAAADAAGWASVCRAMTIDLSTMPIADGGTFAISFYFDDGTGSGARDEVGITDVSVGSMDLLDGGTPPVDAGVVVTDGGTDAGGLDASVMHDGGTVVDAGTVGDGGTMVDAGSQDDAGTVADAGTLNPDGGTASDAAVGADGGGGGIDAGLTGTTDDGCGCSAPGVPTSNMSALWLVGLGAVLLARRRRNPRGA